METISIGCTLLITAIFWDRGILSLGTAYLFYNYVNLIFQPLNSFRNYLGELDVYKRQAVNLEDIGSFAVEEFSHHLQRILDGHIAVRGGMHHFYTCLLYTSRCV